MGNTINVQGSYIDIHDNENVYLSVDKAEVSMGKGNNSITDMSDCKDLARLITDYLAPADKYLKEGWEERMYDFWKAVVKADEDYFAPSITKGTEGFNKTHVYYIVGCLKSRDIYKPHASRYIVKAVGEEENKYRQAIDKRLDYEGNNGSKNALLNAIDKFMTEL